MSEGEASWQWMLSPEGRMYRTRYVALVDMLRRAASPQEVAAMKELMVRHEGWQASPLLPAGWLFKVKCEGWTKDKKWYSTIHYLSEDGQTFESMRNVLKHLAAGQATEAALEACKQFALEMKPVEVKYEWSEGDETVPQVISFQF